MLTNFDEWLNVQTQAFLRISLQLKWDLFHQGFQCVSDNHEGTSAVIGNCSSDHDSSCRSSVSRPQVVWLQEFLSLPSDQHMDITGTKTESAFIKNKKELDSVLQ
ncbi:hypothetical protein TNCV_938101 [Trichonephila clavipes]|nr:hypothetical protein TNCV_938101 [Trichonephila clavipes]